MAEEPVETPPDPTHGHDNLVGRLMRHREISREEAEKLVVEYREGRSSDIDPELLEDIDET